MSFHTCAKCGQKISNDTPLCPHCGVWVSTTHDTKILEKLYSEMLQLKNQEVTQDSHLKLAELRSEFSYHWQQTYPDKSPMELELILNDFSLDAAATNTSSMHPWARLLHYIPGFRSNVLWKKIVSIIAYLLFALMLVTSPQGEPTRFDVAMSVVQVIAFFVLLSLPVITWKSKARYIPWNRKRLWARLLNTSIYVVFATILFGKLASINSPAKTAILAEEKVAAQKVAAQKVAAQKVAAQKVAAQKVAAQKVTGQTSTTATATAHNYKKFSQDMMGVFVEAIESNNTQTVQKFLSVGMNPNVLDTSEDDNIPDRDLLMDNLQTYSGATYDPNENMTADIPVLMIAVDANETEIVNALLQDGANPNLNVRGMSPLLLATIKGYTDDVQALLKSGANANIQEKDADETPIWEAVAGPNANLDMVQLLLAANANPNVLDETGDTPLMSAISYSYKGGLFSRPQHTRQAIINALLKAGANPNEQGSQGYTALMDAANANDANDAKALLVAGANPSLKNQDGQTALDIAQSSQNNNVATLLLNATLNQ